MRVLVLFATVAVVGVASPLLAQERLNPDPRGFISGFGGTTSALGNSTGSVQVEGGVRIAPHLMIFGNLGHFQDLHGDLQPTLDAAVASLSANQGLDVTSTGSIPAWYGSTGLRASIPLHGPVEPYVLGGFGFARLNPQAQFIFSNGPMPDGSTPSEGADVTSSLESSGVFTQPTASTSSMFTTGAGAQVLFGPHWTVDAGYRFYRIGANSDLQSEALNSNGVTFGAGYRF
ncbi:MAG TPA: outer membrane beta-barrel protein [Vicinamibacterales bacterium]|jgi:opacity protein-like surface antigen